MKSFTTPRQLAVAALLGFCVLVRAAPAFAEYENAAVQNATYQVLDQVIYRTALEAREEAAKSASFFPDVAAARTYLYLPRKAGSKLYKLNTVHRRAVRKLEARLYQELMEITRAFERQASYARVPEQVWDLRLNLERDVAYVYANFEVRLTERQRRYRALRARIVDAR